MINDAYLFDTYWSIQRQDYKIERHFEKIFTDTSKMSFEIWLFDKPDSGDQVKIYDMNKTWNKNVLIINNNNQKILGKNEKLICDVEGKVVTLTFKNFGYGWDIS